MACNGLQEKRQRTQEMKKPTMKKAAAKNFTPCLGCPTPAACKRAGKCLGKRRK